MHTLIYFVSSELGRQVVKRASQFKIVQLHRIISKREPDHPGFAFALPAGDQKKARSSEQKLVHQPLLES